MFIFPHNDCYIVCTMYIFIGFCSEGQCFNRLESTYDNSVKCECYHRSSGVKYIFQDMCLPTWTTFVDCTFVKAASGISETVRMVEASVEEIKARFKKNHKTREMVSHSSKVHSVDWSCDGRRLASGEDEGLRCSNRDDGYTNCDLLHKL